MGLLFAIVPIAVSFLSLVVSVATLLRAGLLPFRLKIIPGGLYTVKRDPATTGQDPTRPDEFDLILPINFLNTGYGEGVIQGVAVKVFDESGTAMLYRPTVEIDLTSFVQGPSVIGKHDVISGYMPFPVHAKQSLQKVWLFSQDTMDNPYPRREWRPGTYRFEYFVQESQWEQPRNVATMRKLIEQVVIERTRDGMAVGRPEGSIRP
jgi:hypothetical protein